MNLWLRFFTTVIHYFLAYLAFEDTKAAKRLRFAVFCFIGLAFGLMIWHSSQADIVVHADY